jgi:tetratricopeptide (TPR) repeat protein
MAKRGGTPVVSSQSRRAANPKSLRDQRLWLAAAVLVLAVAAIYGQTYGHKFTSFDDDVYIINNPEVTGGLSWKGFVWAFGYHAANWHPLTWLSHMLDAQIFGLWAGGHHLVSAAIHATNAVLLLLVLRGMTGSFWPSAAVAAIFAVHPLRVESVAWAAERKDVLAGFFWLLATGAYVRYARRPTALRALAVAVFFALGLVSKPMLVTLPFTLLLLDAWPLDRARARAGRSAAAAWGHLTLEKAPLFLMSLLSSLVTYKGQSTGVIKTVEADLPSRLANSAVSYVAYLGSLAWPKDLALLYPFPTGGIPWAATAAALIALAIISATVVLARRRAPYLLTGWLWYAGTLLPVIGIVHVGGQARADRYTYLPMIGATMALAWLAADWWPRPVAARRSLAALFAACLAAFGAAAAVQTSHWKDDLSLYTHATRVTTGNFLLLNNLGSALLEAGRFTEAAAVYEETIRINPEHCNAHYNLGRALLKEGRTLESILSSERALRCYIKGGHRLDWIADTLGNLALAELQVGRTASAERHLLEFLKISPGNRWALSMLNSVRSRQTGGAGAPRAHGR